MAVCCGPCWVTSKIKNPKQKETASLPAFFARASLFFNKKRTKMLVAALFA